METTKRLISMESRKVRTTHSAKVSPCTWASGLGRLVLGTKREPVPAARIRTVRGDVALAALAAILAETGMGAILAVPASMKALHTSRATESRSCTGGCFIK